MSRTSTKAKTPGLLRFSLGGPTMGARYSAVFFANAALETEAIGAALFQAVDLVNQQMSGWKPESDINRLCAAPLGRWVDLPHTLMTVLQVGLQIGQASAGAFDMGVADLVSAWGFGPPQRKPDPARIRALTGIPRLVTDQGLELDLPGQRARRLAPIRIDLSGIAKGFGVDTLSECLSNHGIASHLVGIDGELRARGLKPDGAPWTVAIEQPDPLVQTPMGYLDLVDCAVATSGDYRNRLALRDVHLSHTMDPRTASPLQNGVASVSVLAETCVEADAWATALMVLGDVEGAKLARVRGLDVLFVLREKDGLRSVPVGRFEDGSFPIAR